jgi:hypothetical protein
MRIARIGLHATFTVLLLMGFVGTATAASTNKSASSKGSSSSSTSVVTSGSTTNAAGIQLYSAASPLQIGIIVQLAKGSSTLVTPGVQTDLSEMYGVVVDPNSLPLSITDSNLTNQTYVATTGTYDVLVNTENGTIQAGDYITESAVDGVAMKAGTFADQKTVLGRAVSGFDGKANVIDTTTIKKTNGGSASTVQIGIIPVSIDIQPNPNYESTQSNLPPWLTKLGQQIAQKSVSPIRIYLSIAITGLCVSIALITLYSGVRNAMIAVGRNPLSKKSIFRGLLEVILTGFLILIIGLFAVYLLLKL